MCPYLAPLFVAIAAASKVRRSYNGGNVGTHYVPENDQQYICMHIYIVSTHTSTAVSYSNFTANLYDYFPSKAG